MFGETDYQGGGASTLALLSLVTEDAEFGVDTLLFHDIAHNLAGKVLNSEAERSRSCKIAGLDVAKSSP